MKYSLLSSSTISFIVNYINRLKPKHIKRFRKTELGYYGLNLHLVNGELWILFDPKKGILLPIQTKPELSESTGFTLNIKKKLERSKFIGINQPDFERIIKISLNSKYEEYNLYIELFGEGNLILTDIKNKIIICEKKVIVRHRKISTGEIYQLPPPRGLNPLKINGDKLFDLAQQSTKNIEAFLIDNISVGKDIIQECLKRLEINPNTQTNDLNHEYITKLVNLLQELINAISNCETTPTLVYSESKKTMILPFTPINTEKIKKFQDMSDASEEYFNHTLIPEKEIEIKKTEDFKYQKIQDLMINLSSQIKSLEEEKILIKTQADTLMSFSNIIQLMFIDIESNSKSKNTQNLIKKTFSNITVEKIDEKNKIVHFFISKNPYQLSYNLTVFKSISKIYDKSKKIDRGIISLNQRLIDLKKSLIKEKTETHLLPVFTHISHKKKKWYEKFKWTLSSNDNLIICGKDATTNEILVKKHAEPNDVIFHTEMPGSPFVIVKPKENKISESTLIEAAVFTASNSVAWKNKLFGVNVYYVKPDQLSKTPPTGEYLNKGSFAVKGNRTYMKTELKLAIGIVQKDLQFIVGHPQSIKKHCDHMISFKPGTKKKMEFTKEIVNKLLKMNDENITWKKSQINTLIDEVIGLIPSGSFSITDKS